MSTVADTVNWDQRRFANLSQWASTFFVEISWHADNTLRRRKSLCQKQFERSICFDIQHRLLTDKHTYTETDGGVCMCHVHITTRPFRGVFCHPRSISADLARAQQQTSRTLHKKVVVSCTLYAWPPCTLRTTQSTFLPVIMQTIHRLKNYTSRLSNKSFLTV